jgi:hypothetical protein
MPGSNLFLLIRWLEGYWQPYFTVIVLSLEVGYGSWADDSLECEGSEVREKSWHRKTKPVEY